MNNPNPTTTPALPASVSRRQALKSLGSGAALGLTGAVIVSTTSCAPTEAPAAIHDPLLALINEHLSTREAVRAAGDEDYDRLCDEMFAQIHHMENRTPAATTEAGALAALRLVHEGMGEAGECVFDEPLLKAAMAFLEGRA